MTEDEQFAETLRTRVAPLAPTIGVDESHVLARGRRRRTARRAVGVTAAMGVVAAAGAGVAAFGLPMWGTADAPVVSGQDPTDSSTSTAEPTASIVAPYGPADFAMSADGLVTGVSGDPWDGDDLYWYTATEARDAAGNVLGSSEIWHSRERPGLGVSDGDTAAAWAIVPAAILGSFVVDGVELDQLAEPALLPTDAAALDQAIRASVAADEANDVGVGSTDERVFQKATELLMWGNGTLPQGLREALWQVAVATPGADVRTGTDPDGRAAEIVHFVYQQGTSFEVELFRDPGTALVIATHDIYTDTTDSWGVITQQGTTSNIPVQPTLELAGCSAWLTCVAEEGAGDA